MFLVAVPAVIVLMVCLVRARKSEQDAKVASVAKELALAGVEPEDHVVRMYIEYKLHGKFFNCNRLCSCRRVN